MGLRRVLRSLDDRVLPRLAVGLLRVGRHRRHRPVRSGLSSGIALLALVAGLVGAAWVVRDKPSQHRVPERVGVAAGQSVPAYLADSRRRMDQLSRSERTGSGLYALVSLTAYLAPDRLPPVLSGVHTARAYLRVPLATVSTQVTPVDVANLPGDVGTGMDRVALDRQRIASDFDQLAAGSAAPAAAAQHDQYAAEAAAFRIEATAYRQHCSCVFAAVVFGTPAQLRALGARPAVRAVEPAPKVTTLDGTTFTPLLPEQVDTAGPPDDSRLAPSGSGPSGGSGTSGSGPAASSGTPSGPTTSTTPSGGSPSGSGPPSAHPSPTRGRPSGTESPPIGRPQG